MSFSVIKKSLFLVCALASVTNVSYAQSNIAQYVLHQTAQTKIVRTKDVKNSFLSEFRNGYGVMTSSAGNAFIFNDKAELLGKIENCYQSSIVFEDGKHALAHLKYDGCGLVNYNLVIVNPQGETLCTIAEGIHSSSPKFVDGVARYKVFNEADYFFDVTGKVLFKDTGNKIKNDPYKGYAPVLPVQDGLRPVANEDGTVGFYDSKWNLVIPFGNYSSDGFGDGMAVFSKREGNLTTYGYIDTKGNIAINAKFQNRPGDFHDGYAVVRKTSGKYCYIDKTGNQCSDEYDYAGDFFNGVAMVRVAVPGHPSKKQTLVIDTNFKVVGDTDCDISRYSYQRGCGILYNRGYIYSPYGQRLFKASVNESVNDLSDDGIFIFEKRENNRDYKGYANLKGEILIMFVEDEF